MIFYIIIEGNLNGYQKKKYVCKLLYMYILGWDIDFGHLEAVNLISSQVYSEKQIVRINIYIYIYNNIYITILHSFFWSSINK